MSALRHQPDDPGPHAGICPGCGRPFPHEDADALRLLKANAGKVAPYEIAWALRWPLARLQRFAAAQKIDLTLKHAYPVAHTHPLQVVAHD